jgi:hypothetical protein
MFRGGVPWRWQRPAHCLSRGRHAAPGIGCTDKTDSTVRLERIPGYNSPLTNHGGENDPTHPVIRTGFDRLAALFEGQAPTCFRAFLVDDGSVLPDPSQLGLPAC